MISRSTLVGGLIVVELAIFGAAASALTGIGMRGPNVGLPAPMVAFGPHMANGAARAAVTSTPIDRTFLTGPSPRVMVDVPGVRVSVETGTAPTVHVIETLSMHGWMSGKPASLAVDQTADGVRVHATSPAGGVHVMVGEITHELRVIVPPAALVDLTTGSDVDVTGLRAKLVAHTTSGHVHVRDHHADLDVTTDSGRIELVDVQGTAIDAVSHDGRIYLTRVGADRLAAHSDSGRIVGAGVRAVDGSLTTLDGRILVSFTESSDAVTTVHTDDGDISVSGFPVTDRNDKRQTVRLGAGRGHFELSTGNGPITITQGANV